MNTHGITYTFNGAVWFSEWYFVSLPHDMAGAIRELYKSLEEGWGRLKVTVKIGSSEWNTAIWFDTKTGTYLLPIKKDVRIREKIGIDTSVAVTLWMQTL